MPDDIQAAIGAAPEPLGRMTADDWRRVERHAAPQAIEARLKTARRALSAAQRTVDRWEALLALRLSQVEAGTWPPPVVPVAWRELRAGDVLADDPDRDVLVEVAETVAQDGRDVTTIWYQAPHHGGLYSRSAPADREIVIRPPAGGGEGGRR